MYCCIITYPVALYSLNAIFSREHKLVSIIINDGKDYYIVHVAS
jgi:hypothetical protein